MRALLSLSGVDVPPGVDAQVWGADAPPPSTGLEDVEFYVLPYGRGTEGLSLLAHMPRLRVVQTLSAGVEGVRGLVPEDVTLCNARGVHDASTAELAVALLLAAQRDLPAYVHSQAAGRWEPTSTLGLADRTVLILGYGAIGEAVERRLAGFEVDVLRVARRAREGVADLGRLPELLPLADAVVVLVPLTEATRGLVDAAMLRRMKDGALLVNMARGPVVDTGALLAELSSRRLRAALDVTDPEPLPPGHPLWEAPGLLLTPHVGGGTAAMGPRARALVSDQLARWADGRPLRNVISGQY
ncbi:2-hydroxyacid dehydrogenase [Motilibacter aurantiacus]|uniref:2-hydroxyacid dehydrogenase n=1 Tax=Motilibacter aurantiacus TaxID=2714955 RepID=UPI00140E5FF1|nr:2-hydroxyacid dehydrogenase [Motilibacter aurantiacus]NHC44694.1 2-hydroxyacid dehydrogenase [Motilibacter aurantiacus]